MSGFDISYVAGGNINVKRLPHPIFPRKTEPFTKGLQIIVNPLAQIYVGSYQIPVDMELLSIAVACSAYALDDYWEAIYQEPGGEIKYLCETIYTKELPESINIGNNWGIVKPLKAGTVIRILFHNVSATQKRVWPNLKFLK